MMNYPPIDPIELFREFRRAYLQEQAQRPINKCCRAFRVLGRKLIPITKRGYEEIPKLKEKKVSKGIIRVFIPDAVMGLQDNSNHGYHWENILRECKGYRGQVYFETPRTDGLIAYGRSLADLMFLELLRDSLVDITVEGKEWGSVKREALRIYAGITTKGENPDFERLDKFYPRGGF